jgi:sugar O-acyltransferase (sialic acid O-acetyltransferase NeuD family)
MKDLIIIGGSNTDVIQLVEDINADSKAWNVLGILDDSMEVGRLVFGFPVLGKIEGQPQKNIHYTQSVVSKPQTAKVVFERSGIPLVQFPNLIHPSAHVYRRRDLQQFVGFGSLVFQQVSIQPNATIGNFNYLNIGTVVGHDVSLGNGNSFGPGVILSGRSRIGNHCYLGSGVVVTNSAIVGDWCFLSAGSMVAKDVEPYSQVMGNPARVIAKVETN